ncbi:uncharacterized protein C2orf78 homolog isoform X2 [Crotalus tigris]|uniref:uncharacterized protein C2orf78 homolog isoform X2 n=1 Tax=Crotalus tigris TaxID=88082 RepID=UPI00192F4479|nr:uncharacterized protein C2orf78 homolog isoform X2 [Crotalus tigris]
MIERKSEENQEDQVHNTDTPENQNLPPRSCPILIAVSALGSNLPNFSGMATPVLSNLWIQPPFPHLPVRLIPGNTSLQTFLPPGVSHLQTVHGEQLQLANLAACNPPVSAFPQPFYAPRPPQYETLADTDNHQQIPRPPYPHHRLSGPSLQEVRAPEDTFHLPGSLDQQRSSHHQFVGSPLVPSSSLHYDLEDIPHLLPGLEVGQAPGGHLSDASMEIEVPQASPDQEASEPDHGESFGLSDSQFHLPSKGKGKRKIPWTEEEPSAKKCKEEEKTQHQMPSKTRAKRQQRNKPCKNISVKVAEDAPKTKIFPCVLEAMQNQLQDKMPTELLTIHEDPKVALLELLAQQPGEQSDSSASKGSQTVHTPSGLEKSPPKSQSKQEARKNVSLCGTKSRKCYPRREAEGAPKPVLKTNLACKLMQSVQVFHPLGKPNVSSLPSKKVHSVLPHNPVPDNLIPKAKLSPKSSANPSSQPLITALKPPLHFLPASQLHPQYKPPASSVSESPSYPLSKPSPHCLTKPQSQPWQKRSLIPVPVPTQPPKTRGKQGPLATIPPATKTLDSATQPAAPGKNISLGSKPADVAPNVGQSSNIAAPAKDPVPKGPPSSPPYKGDTYRPWRMPPPDLEASQPITDEQWPIREKMKREAQKEREEAACWTSLGRIKVFKEREKEMDVSLHYGYPSFGCPWRTSTWACPSGRLQAGNVQQLGSDFQSTMRGSSTNMSHDRIA